MSGGLHSLATIIKRLEAATSRVEDAAHELEKKRHQADDPSIESSPNPYPTVPAAVPSAASPPSAPVIAEPQSILAYDEIATKLQPFLELTRSFAVPSLIEQVVLVEKLFTDTRSLLHMAAFCQKPDQSAYESLLVPIQTDVEAISRLRDASRKDRDWFTHLSAVAESASWAFWVTVPKPSPYIDNTKEAVHFYSDRVLTEHKRKDPKHVDWVKSLLAFLEEIRKYVAEYHATGLIWNAKGVPVAQYKASPTPAADVPPPPPPPPPPPVTLPGSAGASSGGAAAVFAELNQGEAVTKGLRKVDKSEMTHKNPALRAGNVVPSQASPPSAKKPAKPTKPQALSGKKPSKFALEGNKWVIEHQENESGLVVERVELNQTVNLYGCKNTTVLVKGKVNAVTLVNCTKTSVLVDSVISTVSVTNSPSFALQITGFAPTIQLDSTDSGQIYLSKDCLGVEITTAKCSSINVSLPVEGEEDGIFEEQAVPEMLKTFIKNGKLVTEVVEHVG
jgi:adenylyl cyclase-associated protein